MQSYPSVAKIVLAVFLTVISFCSTGSAQPAPIRIGFVGDFSDVAKAYTDNAFKAAQMAIADCNAKGGALGTISGIDPTRRRQ